MPIGDSSFDCKACHLPDMNIRSPLRESLASVSEKCIECKLCQKECRFLQKYGKPKQIADAYDPEKSNLVNMAFECSLCRLCAAVCPVKIDPAALFLEMRRESVDRGGGDFPRHSVIVNYERRGTSRRYSLYALPEGCDTVLFPGCALPGTRPDKVKALFGYLEKTIPNLGIVLDCCTKPSHDLGRENQFNKMFDELRGYLLKHGIRTILVACPNCYRVFKQYGTGLQVKTVYEHIAEKGLPRIAQVKGTITIHDPCGTRHEIGVHESVRRIARLQGFTIEEMKHSGEKTLCCGEGGSVGFLVPEFANAWGLLRKQEAEGRRILTYCAGCAHFLGGVAPTSHVIDILFDPEAAMAGRTKVSKAPFTYWNRIRLKRWFKKTIRAANARERTCKKAP